jgi:hypothetical protein
MKTALSIMALAAAALLVGCNSNQTTTAAPGAVAAQKACGANCTSPCCAAVQKTCGANCTKACCAAVKSKTCGADCTKPCCAKKAAPGAVKSIKPAACPLSGGKPACCPFSGGKKDKSAA